MQFHVRHEPKSTAQPVIEFFTSGPTGNGDSQRRSAWLSIEFPERNAHVLADDENFPVSSRNANSLHPMQLAIHCGESDEALVGLIEGLISVGRALDDYWNPKTKWPASIKVNTVRT